MILDSPSEQDPYVSVAQRHCGQVTSSLVGSDLLVHAQRHSVRWRAQVQAHDVTHLLYEVRIGGELETLAAVRLQAKEVEIA